MINEDDDHILNLLADSQSAEKGFKMLMHKYQKPIYRHIMRMVQIHEDANDILQNTFIKVFKNIGKFEQKSKLLTWIYTIATNETRTFLKNRTKKRTSHLETEHLKNQSTNHEIDGEEIMIKLQGAMEQLPKKQKLVFSMRYFDEMSYAQMSDILGTSVGGLKASYHHAVKKIESYIKEQA